jgi:hypothetical protein
MLDITEEELRFCEEWVRTGGDASGKWGDPVKALVFAKMWKINTDGRGAVEELLENPTIRYTVGLMARVMRGLVEDEEDIDLQDFVANQKRILRDLRKVRKGAMGAGQHDSVIKSIELEAKVTGALVERRTVDVRTRGTVDVGTVGLQDLKKMLVEGDVKMIEGTAERVDGDGK